MTNVAMHDLASIHRQVSIIVLYIRNAIVHAKIIPSIATAIHSNNAVMTKAYAITIATTTPANNILEILSEIV